MSSSTLSPQDAIAMAAHQLQIGKFFQLASFVMLMYDHILTFPEEVERIWKRQISGASILFLLNRYITPLQFIVILDAFHDPRWSKAVCERFVAFEGASTVAMIAIIMILRVYALWGRNWVILASLMVLWAAQIAISSAGLSTGFPVPLPPGFTGCIFTGSDRIFPSIWVAPLVTDSCIFILTIWRTRNYLKRSSSTPTMHVFVRDGALYFLAIFLANLMNTLTYFLAPEGLKAIGASFSQLITATMVSRLVLNLKSTAAVVSSEADPSVPVWYHTSRSLQTESMMTRIRCTRCIR
ncbi:hypothetical protein BDQ17DRAFT_1331078 [Cyathus striatus]|nr:hypothetical protein BDQ17DRAFT_1331078 [Cyathus striatus]